MIFKVFNWNALVPRNSAEPMLVLVRDNWNDYGYLTSFQATLVTNADPLELGTVKILRRDQQIGVLTELNDQFTELSVDHCSLGQTISYYELLKSTDIEIAKAVLVGLRDAAVFPQTAAAFEHLEGFQKSLIRSTSARRALADAAILFHFGPTHHTDQPQDQVHLQFLTSVGGNRFEFSIDFEAGGEIPGRLAALIGYNGSGKTRLLANLAMVSATPQSDRMDVSFRERYGQFLVDYSFGGIFALSFSAFDDFEIPGLNAEERRKVSDRQEEYVYCGLRRLKTDDIEDVLISESDTQIRLKSSREIAQGFEHALRRIQNSDRRKLFIEALQPFTMESSFARLSLLSALTQDDDEPLQFFQSLSTGHKIVINVITQMCAHLQKKSLILFDEPETHLHPPLLAALLKSLRLILEDTDSFCLIATHSPVVLQETPGRYVRIIRRNGPKTHIVASPLETFGENVGTLTHEVFNLDSSKTDFHDVLANLAMDRTVSQIEGLFGAPLGFQARSYLFALGAKEN